ncbi:MAG: hypothetical protein M1823_001515 [Watsoniomyces obsoletus]|nr:MAG: hypothetical protein M1823_001515 [Watsoniomyces obsoletus]
MYEKLPVPFGLVRYGVAPDHPEVKNCQDKFTQVASSLQFNFIGNIAVGQDLPLQSLVPHYDAILLAYGASKDRTLNIPGEELKGVYSARAFVGWYNGLPQFAHLQPDLEAGEEAIIIGQGNVALDVARMLLSDVDRLRKTDVTTNALDVLSRSRVKRVTVVGRRGPMQAAFTVREVRELMNLSSVGYIASNPSWLPPDISKLPRTQKRLAQVLLKGSQTPPTTADKKWGFGFFLSPSTFHSSDGSNQLARMTFKRTSIVGDDPHDPQARITSTEESVDLPASLGFRSIGYQSEPLPGLSEYGIPFDHQLGIIPNDPHGRILAPNQGPGELAARHIPGFYVAGWSKRGPTGVIASTMDDAFATADAIAQDWENQSLFLNDGAGTGLGWDGIKMDAERRGLRRVSWTDWEKIDAAEKHNGMMLGKEREKFTSIEDMMRVLDG